ERPWGFVNVGLRSYYAEGSKTLAYEIAEQLGWELPDLVVCPIASGSLYTKLKPAFSEFPALWAVEGRVPRLLGAQAAGCAPVATAFADGGPVRPVRPDTVARSLAIGAPADGDLAVATPRETGGPIRAARGGGGGRGVGGDGGRSDARRASRRGRGGRCRTGRPGRPARHGRRPQDTRAG